MYKQVPVSIPTKQDVVNNSSCAMGNVARLCSPNFASQEVYMIII